MRGALLCLAVLLAACGTGTEDAQDQIATDEPAATSGTQACEDRTPAAPKKEAETGSKKPKVEIPDGAPPCELVIQDINEGTGTQAKEGATVTVHYVGVAWSTGKQFDASWDRGEPANFPLDGVIKGWQEGIPDMKEGGRRRLIIPPDLAYGAAPPPGSGIAPNETLVFVIDLIQAE